MDISSIMDADYILLKSSFLNHNSSDFQCRYKENLYKGRSDFSLIVKNMRKEKGCLKIGDEPVVEFDGIEFYSCLCHDNFQHPDYQLIFELHQNFKKGMLPFNGSFLEQPAQIMEAIMYLDGLYAEKEYEDNLKKAKQVNNGK